jgi:hypothetical protein
MYPSVKAARDVHVYMHSSTQPGSGPRLLLSFVCRLFPLQSRCFLSCLTFVPHSALEACWVTAEWPVLPFLGVSWSPPCWLFFLPIGCGHICTELFILTPQSIFTPFFDHDTSGAALSPPCDIVLHLVVVHLVPSFCWAPSLIILVLLLKCGSLLC